VEYRVNYPEIGATRTGPLPKGHRHLVRTADLDVPLRDAVDLVMTWGLQERCGLRPETDAERAAPGAEFCRQDPPDPRHRQVRLGHARGLHTYITGI